MDVENQKQLFFKVIKELDNLNELLVEDYVEDYKFANYLTNGVIELETKDLNLYLASLCSLTFRKKYEKINLRENDANKFIIINFINTIIGEMGITEFEVEIL